MAKPSIEEFAALLVREVRDEAIENCDMSLSPTANYSIAKRWRIQMKELSPEEFARAIIPDCVDAVLAQLLRAIDNEELLLSFTTSAGALVDLSKEGRGEMVGEYFGPEGWRYTLSGQRVNDDFTG